MVVKVFEQIPPFVHLVVGCSGKEALSIQNVEFGDRKIPLNFLKPFAHVEVNILHRCRSYSPLREEVLPIPQ